MSRTKFVVFSKNTINLTCLSLFIIMLLSSTLSFSATVVEVDIAYCLFGGGRKGGAGVRVHASHQCGLDSNPGLHSIL